MSLLPSATRVPYPSGGLEFFRPSSYSTFLAIVSRIVPRDGDLPAAETPETVRVADRLMAEKEPAVQADFRKFLAVFEWLALLLHGKRFSRLAPDKQDLYMRLWEDSPARKMRQGFWGAKTLSYIGFYSRPESWDETGYGGPPEITLDGPRWRHAGR